MNITRFIFRLFQCCVLICAIESIDRAIANEITLDIPKGLIEPDIPDTNTLTQEKLDLGKKLFFDTRLSSTSRMSCATCHNPEHGFSEKRSISFNANGLRLERNAPSVLNAGYLATVTWDGRFRTLEDQIQTPFSKSGDMDIEIDEAITIIQSQSDYNGLFEATFGRAVDKIGIAQALACYQRSLISANSPFDEFLFKGDISALSQSAMRGYELFIGKASCITCHDIFHPTVNSLGGALALFTDHRFHNLGVGYKNGKMSDTGRYWTTRAKEDWGAFKTPILRNVALTSPYMHDGSLPTLRKVVEFYNDGGIPNPNIAPGIRPLFLTDQEITDIVSFLESLTDNNLLKQSR
ncbi:cytochrome-c peroxidase [Methylomonas sp. 11b]|uniref:cytochrome-c peroxidase n=1 Tax=Methylomonas sp. 11b TaxID=1168169 RepID=UPI0004B50DB8|nr:cytochrome c peroxidase [Methylomonas sp. 11b]